jgi:hypothetical protein
MGLFRDFILGQPLKNEGEAKEEKIIEKPIEEKPTPKIVAGRSYSPKDFMTLVAEDDPVYHRMFTTGEFSQNREQLAKKLEEIVNEKKKKGESFNRDNISKLARELASGDRISQLLAKAINNKLQ